MNKRTINNNIWTDITSKVINEVKKNDCSKKMNSYLEKRLLKIFKIKENSGLCFQTLISILELIPSSENLNKYDDEATEVAHVVASPKFNEEGNPAIRRDHFETKQDFKFWYNSKKEHIGE